jgi:hypothetical protein
VNDPFDDRITRALRSEATLDADPAAAHEQFVALQTRRRRRLQISAGIAMAVLIAGSVGLAITRSGHHNRQGLTATGAPRAGEPQPAPGETVPPPSGETTDTSTSGSAVTASTVAGRSTNTTRAPTPTAPHPTPSSTAPATGPGPPPSGSIVVTNADNGKHYTLVRGQYLVVELDSEGYMWTEPDTSNSGVLPRDGGWTRSDGSAYGTFKGASTGTADVSSDGRSIPPPCATATPPCLVPDHILHFSVSVTVVG